MLVGRDDLFHSNDLRLREIPGGLKVMTKETTIYITEQDHERLENLIERVRSRNDRANIFYVNRLEEELDYAEVVTAENIRRDVVTMRSIVQLLDLDTGEENTYSIVFPSEANTNEGKISILAPLATALLGHKREDSVEVQAPGRVRRLKIRDILYQPESAGDYNL
jgi:regulator of nucleoside diphosphate kinase